MTVFFNANEDAHDSHHDSHSHEDDLHCFDATDEFIDTPGKAFHLSVDWSAVGNSKSSGTGPVAFAQCENVDDFLEDMD